MTQTYHPVFVWITTHFNFLAPLILATWMAWGDVRQRRIPNYLTLGTALAGLGYQLATQGLAGLGQGFLGLGLGFFLMLPFYLKGGMGAGDVKALAALGAWLGPLETLYLFVYMGLAGLPLIIFHLWQKGTLGVRLRQFWAYLLNLFLLHSHPPGPKTTKVPNRSEGLPYAVAMALGMGLLFFRFS